MNKRWTTFVSMAYMMLFMFFIAFFIYLVFTTTDTEDRMLFIAFFFIITPISVFAIISQIEAIKTSTHFDLHNDGQNLKVEYEKGVFTISIRNILGIEYDQGGRYPGSVTIYYLTKSNDNFSKVPYKFYHVIQWSKKYPDMMVKEISYSMYFTLADDKKIRGMFKKIHLKVPEARFIFNSDKAIFCPNCGDLVYKRNAIFNINSCAECGLDF